MMSNIGRTYLALGDSMSIDAYTGVVDGGAVKQFYRTLGEEWTLDDRTYDGCQMAGVTTNGRGDLITLTIGGNDLLWNREVYVAEGIADFVREHLDLLEAIRTANPESTLIVGDIYEPEGGLSRAEYDGLAEANAAIAENCHTVGARLAPIHEAFLGNQSEYLCLGIEPTFKGAEAIAGLFRSIYEEACNA